MIVDEILVTFLNCFRSTLRAIGKSCAQAVPAIGQELEQALLSIDLNSTSDAAAIQRASKAAEAELANWSDRAARYYGTQTAELKQIMIAVARVAGTIAERDEGYAQQIEELSRSLIDASRLEGLAEIRQCLAQNAGVLSATSEALKRSSRDSVDDLRAEVVRYETLLRESEQRSLRDPLTGLHNRRGIEEELQTRTEKRRAFSVLIFDLNGFKKVNDTFGHVAGDDLLKQFADELKSRCDRDDVAGRLGGDEFLVITNRCLEDAEENLRRTRSWIFGNYKINDGQRCHPTNLTGSAGLAEWDGKETISSLLSRADQAMYREKAEQSGPPPRNLRFQGV